MKMNKNMNADVNPNVNVNVKKSTAYAYVLLSLAFACLIERAVKAKNARRKTQMQMLKISQVVAWTIKLLKSFTQH